MNLARTTDATVELLTADEMRDHLRLDETSEDAYVAGLRVAARQRIEEDTSRALITQTWTLRLDAFPSGDEIRLPRPPLQSVTSITYVDVDGVTQTWAAENYVVDTTSEPGCVRLAYGATWPSTRGQPNAVTIVYVCGYGADPSAVPQPVIHAAKLLVGGLYENREPEITGTIVSAFEMSYRFLIAPYVFRFW